jgi:hypothetical protein
LMLATMVFSIMLLVLPYRQLCAELAGGSCKEM